MKSTRLFPTFPSKAALEKRRNRIKSPVVGDSGGVLKGGEEIVDFGGIFADRGEEVRGGGFSLKLV